ncbi:MAG TPA: carboxypeptidase-like regulatory domain-containing protein [Blastocatellia bacterium]|nr:carboxypeptidase-like regulatory domain-containing protein [Blastocatellia bacterium]
MSIKEPRVIGSVLLLLLSLFPVRPAFAQTTSGTVVGIVRDNSGKGVPKALVIAENSINGYQQIASASESGTYRIPNLPQGFYKLTAHKKGFVDDSIPRFAVQFNQKNAVELPKLTLHTVTLGGKVLDRSNTPLLDAQVVVTNQSDGASRAASTNQYGDYSISDLSTGNYIVTASYPASNTASHQGCGASPGESVVVALDRREIWAPTITIIVDAVNSAQNPPQPQPQPSASVLEESKYGALIHPFDAARTTNFTQHQIESLPLGGSTYMRTFDDLALLAAGVAPPPFTPGVHGPGVGFGIGTAGQFSVNGMRARSNNFSVDGSDNNDPDVGVRRQGFVALVPQPIESVMEVSISTLLWDAELGRNFGSQVNAVSKYGPNKYHGQAFGFLTDSRLNARDAFARRKDPFTHTQAGFVISGPVAGARTQFFGSYEHQKINASAEQHFATPTLAERRFSSVDQFGSLGSLDGPVIGPFRRTTPLGDNILSLYPAPNNAGGPFGANTFTELLAADGLGNLLSFRMTHRLAEMHTLDARYNFTDDDRILPSVNRAIRSTLESGTRSHNLSLMLNSTLSPRLYNLARFSFGRTSLSFSDYPDNPFIFSRSSTGTVGRGGSTVPFTSQTGPIGELLIEPFSPVGVGAFTFPQSRASNTFQYADTMSLAAGEHLLKFGGNVRRYQLNSLLDRLYRPQVVYSGGLLMFGDIGYDSFGLLGFKSVGEKLPIPGVELASLGVASSVLQTITSGAPDSTLGLRSTEYHFFINDTWRVRPNLSIDYGLRYEYNTVPRDAHNRIEDALALADLPTPGESRFDSSDRSKKFNDSVGAYKKVLDGRTGIYEPDHNNFGPHVGAAWAPGGNTAVRAGYGIYYDTILGAVVSQSRNVFSREIPINVDPSFLQFSLFSLNNPAFLQIVMDANGNFTNPVSLLKPGTCNRFGTCNQFGGSRADFVALIGQLFSQNPFGGLAFTLPEKNLRTPYSQQWHLTIERQLADDYFVSAAYVGTKGTKLTRLTTPNLGVNVTPAIPLAGSRPGANSQEPFAFPVIYSPFVGSSFVVPCNPCLAGGFSFALRPNPDLGAYQIFENSAASTYHALQLEARKRYSTGFQFTAAYTWSHAIDDVSDVFPIAGAPVLAQDSLDLRAEKASANFDVRHRFAASLVWDLPYFSNSTGRLKKLAAGWQLASIFQAHTGQPFTLNVPFDANLDGNLSDRPSTTNGLLFFSGHGSRRVAVAPGVQPEAFFEVGADGAVGRNTVRGDGFVNLDVAISKRFQLSERNALDFRAESFNVMNRANFGLPIRTIGAPGFGSAVETAAPARVIQFGLKLSF